MDQIPVFIEELLKRALPCDLSLAELSLSSTVALGYLSEHGGGGGGDDGGGGGGDFSPGSAILPLAPGLLAYCTPDTSRAYLPPSLGASTAGVSPGAATGWVPLPAALSFLNSYCASQAASREHALDAQALLLSSEQAIRERCASRAAAKAALERYLGVANIEIKGDNVVEVKEESGESVMYITEFEPPPSAAGKQGVEVGGLRPLRAAVAASAAAAAALPDAARQRAIMKRLSYLEACEAGKEHEWTDLEGRDPLPPLSQSSAPLASAPLPAVAAVGTAAAASGRSAPPSQGPIGAASGAGRAASGAPLAGGTQATAPAGEKAPPIEAPPLSIFKQRMLAAKKLQG